MIKLVTSWHIPDGQAPSQSDALFLGEHVGNVRRLPKLKRHVVLKAMHERGTHPSCWRGEDLWFESDTELDETVQSAEWQTLMATGLRSLVAGFQIDLFEVGEEYFAAPAPEPGRGHYGPDGIRVGRGMWHLPVDAQPEEPVDAQPEEIDRFYFDVHVPNVRAQPGVHRHQALKAVHWPRGEHPRHWRAAETWFGSRADFELGMASPEQEVCSNDGFTNLVTGLQFHRFYVEEEWTPTQ